MEVKQRPGVYATNNITIWTKTYDIQIALPVIHRKMLELGLEKLAHERQNWLNALASIALLAHSRHFRMTSR